MKNWLVRGLHTLLVVFMLTLHSAIVTADTDIEQRTANIMSEGVRLHAELFYRKDDEGKKLPTIIMAHGWGGVAAAFRRDATELGPAGKYGGFTLLFADPPYDKSLIRKALDSAAAGGWLAPGAVCVLEDRAGSDIDLPANYTQLDSRAWGDTQVVFARFARP